MDTNEIERYKKAMLDMQKRATVTAATESETAPDQNGRLMVSVTTLNGLYPVAGAAVTVFSGRDGTRSNIDSDISNESGQTKVFTLPAPEKALSENSEFTGVTYSLYNIAVVADGFLEQLHYGIPVFSGVTSIKTADLTSLSVAGGDTAPQVFEETVDFDL